MSGNALVHTIAFFAAFLSLIVASFVFVRMFVTLGQRGWASYCAATGVISPVLIVLGSANPSMVGVIIAVAGAIAFGWVSVMAARLLVELRAAK